MSSSTSLPETVPSPTNFLSKNDIEKLYSHFLTLDRDGQGYLTSKAFLEIPSVANNPLASRLLKLFDPDGDDRIDFEEFTNILATFSSKGARDDKLKLAFAIYDLDGDGLISPGELFISLRRMAGAHLTDCQLQQVVDKTIRDADEDGDGRVSFDEFRKIVVDRNHDFIDKWALADI